MRSQQVVLGDEIELDFAPNGKTADVLSNNGRRLGNISQSEWDRELCHLELFVRYARRREAYQAHSEEVAS